MKATGINPENNLVEIIEVANHPWFVGAQFHPEYKSTVTEPHPLFIDFVKTSAVQSSVHSSQSSNSQSQTVNIK
jgi:CTP synthase